MQIPQIAKFQTGHLCVRVVMRTPEGSCVCLCFTMLSVKISEEKKKERKKEEEQNKKKKKKKRKKKKKCVCFVSC